MKLDTILIFQEETAIMEFKSKLRAVLGDNLIRLDLFGSKASGKSNEYSDIDIFVLVRKLDTDLINEIARLALQIDLKYNVLLSPLVYDQNEFEQNKKLGSPIIKELDTKGIRL